MIITRKIIDKFAIPRRLPSNFKEGDPAFSFFKDLEIQEVPAIRVFEFENVYVDSDCVTYDDKRNIYFELFEFCLKKKYAGIRENEELKFKNLRHPRRFIKSAFKKIRHFLIDLGLIRETHLNGKYILFSDDRVNNFYHWMMDALPRLVALGGVPAHAKLLLPQKCWENEYVKSTLKLFGINEENIYFIKEGQTVRVSELEAVSCPILATGGCHPYLLSNVKEKIETFYDQLPDLDFGDKIYISRQRASSRKVVNEDSVMQILDSYGFKCINAEDYSFWEQVNIMRKAKYLIGLTGAGLTQMMFMKKGGGVLELIHAGFICPTDTLWPGGYSDKYAGTYYYCMANVLGLEYYYQESPRTNDHKYLLADNIEVNINQLKQNVEMMLQSRLCPPHCENEIKSKINVG